MVVSASTSAMQSSPPSRGAWIEMSIDARLDKLISSRPPRGGRGLKSTFARTAISPVWVAPLAGGVD